MGVDHPGDQRVINMCGLTGNVFSDCDPFLRGFMRQHRPGDAIADGIHAADCGGAMVIDRDAARVIELQADSLKIQPVTKGSPTHRHHQFIYFNLLAAVLIVVVYGDGFSGNFAGGDFAAHADVQALLFEQFQCVCGNSSIRRWQEFRHGLQDGHLCAKTVPDTAQFKADDPGANHAQPFGNFGERQGPGVIHNPFAIGFGNRNINRDRAAGNDNIGST